MKRQFEPEQSFVIESFQKSFAEMKTRNIVLYGIGKNTEAVLYGTEGFSFYGLMDQMTTGQTFFEKRVLSEEEVIALHPLIVIIARESVVNIIYKRIQYLDVEHGIEIYDVFGNLLGQENLVYRNGDLPYWQASYAELMDKMKEYETISFDIFDTLLMRRVLQPEDVFSLVEERLRKIGMVYPFATMRLKAEQSLYSCPDLDEIYVRLQEIMGWSKDVISQMKGLEYETDRELFVRREQMCKVYQIALDMGKEVYLISDMYYSKEYLSELLKSHGIEGYKDLFVSSELKREKSNGKLFEWYNSQVSGRKLHIGDNRRADIQKAIESGIDAYHIYSAYELLMASTMQGILADTKTLQQRCILGLIIAKVFNNPFALHGLKGRVMISDVQKVGYCFVAPMLVEFAKWFSVQVKKLETEQILFPSRDGYLLQKVYDIIAEECIESVYFRTSRRAVSVAGIREFSDVERIACRKYQGTYKEFLKTRFGVEMRVNDERGEKRVLDARDEVTYQLLKDYELEILAVAEREREQYLGYLENMNILEARRQVLFDFVAGGTVQFNLSKLLQREMIGIYFATMNLPNDMYEADTDRIIAAYGNIKSYGVRNNLGKHYLFLETVLIDNKETFSHIDISGEEVFLNGSAKSNYRSIENLQEAILDYAKDYKKSFGMLEVVETEFTDVLFGALFSDMCEVDEAVKAVFQGDDVYDGIGTYPLWKD